MAMRYVPAPAAAAGTPRLPVTLIGGFLGAGKTTLLNSLLTQAQGRRFAVLVNDFGELNIDAQLVQRVDGQRVELANGCICCTIRDDLVAGVKQFLDVPQPPEQVLIETSGVSDPLNVLHTFSRSALRNRVFIDNVVTVVDALNAVESRNHEYWPLFERQLQAAYMVVLNKLPLADAARQAAARALVAELAPLAPVLESGDGGAALDLLIGGDAAARAGIRPEPSFEPAPHPFVSTAFRSEKPLVRERFLKLLSELGGVFRAKGLIQFRHYPLATVFQMVGARRTLDDGPAWGAMRPRTELVFIGAPATLDAGWLQAALRDCEAP